MNLRDVLSRYLGKDLEANLGGESITKPQNDASGAPVIDVSSLRMDIMQVRQSNSTYFLICFVSLVVLFIGCGALVIRFLNEPSKAAAIFGVTGLSFLGIVAQMLKLWKQKVASDLTLAIAGSLPSQQLLTALETILRELRT